MPHSVYVYLAFSSLLPYQCVSLPGTGDSAERTGEGMRWTEGWEEERWNSKERGGRRGGWGRKGVRVSRQGKGKGRRKRGEMGKKEREKKTEGREKGGGRGNEGKKSEKLGKLGKKKREEGKR